MLDVFDVLNRFNKDIGIDLKFDDLFFNATKNYSFDHTATALRKIYKRNRKALEKALKADCERKYFPIRVGIIFSTQKSSKSFELEEFSFYDKHDKQQVWPTLYFRQKIKKLNGNFKHDGDVQKMLQKFLKSRKFSVDVFATSDNKVVTNYVYSFRKSYTTIDEFERDVVGFEKTVSINFERVDKDLFQD